MVSEVCLNTKSLILPFQVCILMIEDMKRSLKNTNFCNHNTVVRIPGNTALIQESILVLLISVYYNSSGPKRKIKDMSNIIYSEAVAHPPTMFFFFFFKVPVNKAKLKS